ncbi:glycosyltransferase family 61 protein [Paenibacillus aceris]|uniref:Capsular polysaccharide biosynthesis protein n=1 Tax=Paenibacillus aceris TaxID=869555 RepID=A0ABS4I924_9BACL|nr:glycosyltransferase family 61 protein [Paenibacillus aceris]MBP1966971.1 capsular polysaccharide biosynthesis protein [Paenibacillus aceris]NHW39335.1 glycosyltransferase family 61 protein [Paenibacillus aceris]
MTQSESDLAIPSKRDYQTIRQWFKTGRSLKYKHKLKQFHFHQSVPFPEPKTIEKKLHWYFRRCSAKWKEDTLFPTIHTAVIKKGRIYGARGIVLTPENKLIRHISYPHILAGKDRLPEPVYLNKTVAYLSFRYPNNYFHWMFDVLPRIALLRECKVNIDKYVISPPGNFPYKEMLRALGIPEKKVIIASEDFHIKANKVVVVDKYSKWAPYVHVYPEWTSKFLRDELSGCNTKGTSKKYERLYVSRAHAGGRKMTNEDEVVRCLESHGFHCIHPDTMSFAEQIRAFQSADIIVSPHGASLANLVFTKPGTKLIEIFSPNYVRDYYLVIAAHMKLDYYYLIGDGKRPIRDHKYTKGLYDDITVNIDGLTKILQKAGVHK